LEAISNASEKMLENNGHFLHAKIVIEQQAIEITWLQGTLDTQNKENHDLNVQITTLKCVWPFLFFEMYAPLTTRSNTIALFANDYHVGSRATGHVLATIRCSGLPNKPPAHKCEDFPDVALWTRKDFRRATANTQRGDTDAMRLPYGARQDAGDLARIPPTTMTTRRRITIWRTQMGRFSLQLKLQR
jgi:hypothetical protein